jgi:hypothetical protein
LVQEIGRTHRHQPRQGVHILFTQPLKMAAQFQQPQQVAGVKGGWVGRRDTQNIFDRLGHVKHVPAIFIIGFCIPGRMASDVAHRPVMVAVPVEVVAVRQRRQGTFQRQNRQPKPRQLQVADNFRP